MDKNKRQIINPGLYAVSTPIGNMEDMTFRAINILKKSNVILCEDTRRSGKLLSYFKIKSKLFSYHKFNEKKVSNSVIDFLKQGQIVSLITDAGTPTISDPGLIIVNKCVEENINVYPVPGPSAVTSAVSISGFSDQYLFYGFLEKKKKELEKVLKNLSNINYSIVFFIPAIKINFFIEQFNIFFFDRKILIAREMTKVYESYIRDKVAKVKNLSDNLRGELTVVISEKNKENKFKKVIDESVKIKIKEMIKKYSIKVVVEFISKKENLPKKIVYNFCLKAKK